MKKRHSRLFFTFLHIFFMLQSRHFVTPTSRPNLVGEYICKFLDTATSMWIGDPSHMITQPCAHLSILRLHPSALLPNTYHITQWWRLMRVWKIVAEQQSLDSSHNLWALFSLCKRAWKLTQKSITATHDDLGPPSPIRFIASKGPNDMMRIFFASFLSNAT